MSTEPHSIERGNADLVAQRELTRILRFHDAIARASRKPLVAPLAIAFLASWVFVIPTALLCELFFGTYDSTNPDARGGIYLFEMILGAVVGFMATRYLATSRARFRIDTAIQELNGAVKEVGTLYPMVVELAGGESRLLEFDSVTELLQRLSDPRSRDCVKVEESEPARPSTSKSTTSSANSQSPRRPSDEITEVRLNGSYMLNIIINDGLDIMCPICQRITPHETATPELVRCKHCKRGVKIIWVS